MKHKKIISLLLAYIMLTIGTGITVFAEQADKTELYHKIFDFGYDNVKDDFIPVTAQTKYAKQTGFGLTSVSGIKAGGEKESELLEIFRPYDPANIYYAKKDYLTTTDENGICFEADVPDGDYTVNVIAGGETETNVNIYINGGERVRMYQIEAGDCEDNEQPVVPKDGKITVQAKGENVKINAIEITQLENRTEKADKPTIYIAGDSTAQTYKWETYYPQTGWGQVFADYASENIIIENRSIGGRSLKSYNNDGRLDRILTEMHPGDYVVVQFGHNDGSEKPERFISVDDFKILLEEKYINEIVKRGGTPLIFTPTPHFSPDDSGKFAPTILNYSAASMEIGKKCGVPVLDIQQAIADRWNVLGQEKVKNLYFINEPLESAQYPEGTDDHTHFKEAGAREVAQVIAKELSKNIPELKDAFILDRTAQFTDTRGHWAEDVIDELYQTRCIEGISDTEFAPEQTVTRAEFLAMAMRACGIPGHGYREGECLNMPADAWYRFYVQSAVDKKIIPKEMIADYAEQTVKVEATDDKPASEKTVITGTFDAERSITREEMAAIAVNCYEYAWTQAGHKAEYHIIMSDALNGDVFNVEPTYTVHSGTRRLDKGQIEFSAVEEGILPADQTYTVPTNGETVDFGKIQFRAAIGGGLTDGVVLRSDDMAEWAKDYIVKAAALRLMIGYYTDLRDYRVEGSAGAATYQLSTTEFAPKDSATRAQAAMVISTLNDRASKVNM